MIIVLNEYNYNSLYKIIIQASPPTLNVVIWFEINCTCTLSVNKFVILCNEISLQLCMVSKC